MNERLLQFIWQLGYFNHHQLVTTDHLPIELISRGQYNTNQGPDFLNARIRIGKATWAGQVELHVRASDWDKHAHSNDENFRNVILHVVYINDISVDHSMPVLELKDRIPYFLVSQYETLMASSSRIACRNSLKNVQEITWLAWKDSLLIQRLENRAASVLSILEKTGNHWEETFWWLLARGFGMKLNADLFELVAAIIPLKLLSRHKQNLFQLEALLFGAAGLLNKKFTDEYARLLQREYRFFQKKYQLKRIHHPVYFLRMRPASFPTIKLAQLAALIHSSEHLFSRLKETSDIKSLRSLFNIETSSYWHNHYRFDEIAERGIRRPGNEMISHVIINTIIPVLYTHACFNKDESMRERCIRWMQQLPPELNSITRTWTKENVENNSAFDSQALIELMNEYCIHKKCLDCAIGNSLLRKDTSV